ncbi:MAG: AAA family ATPase [Ginsengibacter sp.]
MTNLPQKEDIRLAINNYCQLKGISKNELATQSGVSSATLSKIEHQKWEDIDDKLWRKIWNKVNENTTPDIIETKAFIECKRACEAARKNHFMIGLVADTGIGKTTALTSYSLRKNVFYVPYDKTMKPKQFFAALIREMGIAFEGSINAMVNRIADELNVLTNPLLIIDEAGKIPHTMILFLHVLRDKTIKNCGIVLGGMPYFKSNLIKFSNKEKEGYAEFLRRINMWQTLEGLSRAEINFICQEHGITDAETIREMLNKKKFGDLYNAILLHQIEKIEAL